jgi:hypothetical protein
MERAFLDAVREIRNGASMAELGEQLTALVERVASTGKAGKLTYTLTVKPATAGDGHVLMVDDDIKVKLPVEKRGGTIFFSDDSFALSRKDPRQPELTGLREATVRTMTPKEAANA